MLTDICTVARKELVEIVLPDGGLRGSARNVLILLGVAGIWFPLQAGPRWFASWTTVGVACFPLMLVLNHAMDAFAGERERHTLETLLATRLDGRSILLGKTLAIVLYGWTLVVLGLPIGLVAVNLVPGGAGFLFFKPAILASVLVVAFCLALLFCSVGILISIGAPTVRTAGQRLLGVFFVILTLPYTVPYLLNKLGWQQTIARLEPIVIVMLIAAGFLLCAAAALGEAMRRFDRERLVLV